MTAAQKQSSLSEYLELERISEVRHEYYAGQIVAMAGASEDHIQIANNATRSLEDRLEGRECRVYQSDMRVRTTTTLYTYPDVVVACGAREFEGDRRDTLINPILVIEVLSPSTESYDRGLKFEHYRSVPSLKSYLLIAQDRVSVELFERMDSGKWLLSTFDQMGEEVPLAALGIRIPVADLYRRIPSLERGRA